MIRELTTIERSFLQLAERVTMNPVVMVRGRGIVDVDRLAQAAADLQRRQPALAVRLVRDETPWFTTKDVPTPPILVVERRDAEHWREVVTEELNIPFDIERGPLIRFVVIQGEDEFELVCTTDHLNADGRSGLFALRDILKRFADPDAPMIPLEDRGSFDRHLPGGLWDLGRTPEPLRRLSGERLRDMTNFARSYARRRDELRGGARPPEAPTRAPIEFVHRTLEPEVTRALVKACRQHGVTVQGALTIASCHGLATAKGLYVEGHRKIRIGSISPIDIRPLLEPPVGEHFGIFAWAPSMLHAIHEGADFWTHAAQVRENLQRSRSRLALAGMRRLLDVTELLEGTQWTGLYSNPLRRITRGLMVVSNLGRIELERQYGELEIESFGFFAMIPDVDYVLGVQSFHDRMELDYCWSPSWSDKATVEHAADVVDDTLRALAEDPEGAARCLLGAPARHHGGPSAKHEPTVESRP